MKRLAIILTLIGQTAGAQVQTGNEVYRSCEQLLADQNNIMAGYCIGYITGAWEGIKIGSAMMIVAGGTKKSTAEVDQMTNTLLRVCIPKQAETGQILSVFLKYLEENPATRHEAARSLLHASLVEAFPCR